MGLQEQQNVLAKLFTDAGYRRAFFLNSESVGTEAGLSSIEIRDILAVQTNELSFFSDSLLSKRRREVEKMIPLVRTALGESFDSAFSEFAAFYNPQLVNKHREDAIEFCKFLDADGGYDLLARDAAAWERTRLEFFGSNKRYAFCLLNHDFRELRNDFADAGLFGLRRRRTLAVWLRLGRRVRQFVR